MIPEFRTAVYDALAGTGYPLHGDVPDNLSALPAVVVGRVNIEEGGPPGTFDLNLTVWCLGRRYDGVGSEAELDQVADDVVMALGGTRSIDQDGHYLHVAAAAAATTEIAGKNHPAYTVTVETSTVTC